jgi:hypothetical protein
MDAVEFFKVKGRICYNRDCEGCVLYGDCIHPFRDDHDYEKEVAMVEKWAKENPIPKYTYLDDLLSKLPDTELNINGLPHICLVYAFGKKHQEECCDTINCVECWNREYKEK